MKQALLYSGGVESTLLYYTLLQKATETQCLDLFIVDRYNNPVGRAMTLYNMLRQEFEDESSTCQHLTTPDKLNNTERMMYAVKELSKFYEAIHWGINAYPPNIRPKKDQFKNLQRKLEELERNSEPNPQVLNVVQQTKERLSVKMHRASVLGNSAHDE